MLDASQHLISLKHATSYRICMRKFAAAQQFRDSENPLGLDSELEIDQR